MDGKLAQAVNSAVEETLASQQPQPEAPAEGEPKVETPAPATPAGESASDADPKDEGTPPEDETPPQGDTSQDEEVPEDYFGLDLSEFSPETRKTIIDRVKGQDQLIQSQQRKLAAQQKALEQQPTRTAPEAETPAPEQRQEPAQATDEDILKSLGLDPDDPMYEVKKELSLPLARMLLQQGQVIETQGKQLSEFQSFQQNQATLTYWEDTLAELEGEYGKLPYTREEVFDFALENEVFDPTDTFFRLYAPVVKQLSQETAKERAEVTKAAKRSATTTRPRATTPTEQKEVRKGNIRSSVTEAARIAAEELGTEWDEAIQESVLSREAVPQ